MLVHNPCTLWFKLCKEDSTDRVDLDELSLFFDLDHLLVSLLLSTTATEEGFLLFGSFAHLVDYLEILFNLSINKIIKYHRREEEGTIRIKT